MITEEKFACRFLSRSGTKVSLKHSIKQWKLQDAGNM